MKIIPIIFLCSFFSGCSARSNFYIINISEVPVRISYQLKSLRDYDYFEKNVSKFKVIREEEEYSIGAQDTSFVYTDTDSLYEIILNSNEALRTGSYTYHNILENTEHCEWDFENLKYLSISKLGEADSISIETDSIYITGNMMCSVIEEVKKYTYALVIR